MTIRCCISCRQKKDRDELIKITAEYTGQEIVVNPDCLTFGRSAYLCYNKSCIETAFIKNKLGKYLKKAIPNELKGQILNELRNN